MVHNLPSFPSHSFSLSSFFLLPSFPPLIFFPSYHSIPNFQGEVVIPPEEPHTFALHDNKLSFYCSHCLRKPTTEEKGVLKRCTRCQYTWYCSKTCQVSLCSSYTLYFYSLSSLTRHSFPSKLSVSSLSFLPHPLPFIILSPHPPERETTGPPIRANAQCLQNCCRRNLRPLLS